MGKWIRVIILCILCAVLLCTGYAYAQSSMDRIRAVESLSYFVETRFPAARIHRRELNSRITEDLREPVDSEALSIAVASMLDGDKMNKGRLWVHRDLRRVVEKWDRFGGRLSRDRIIVYEDISQLVKGFDAKDDLAVMQTRDLEKLALSNGHDLQNAVILSPLEIRLEYMDGIYISLLLMRQLRSMLAEGQPGHIVKTDEFTSLKGLLESLLAMRAGFADSDILDMIPRTGLPFARRALAILQNSMNPIMKQDLRILREIQMTFRSV